MKRLKWKLLLMLLCVLNSNSTPFEEDVDQIYNMDLTKRGRTFFGLKQYLIEALTNCELAPGKNVELVITPPEGATLDNEESIIETIKQLLPSFIATSDTTFKVEMGSKGPLSEIKLKIFCGFRTSTRIGDFLGSVRNIVEPFKMKVDSIKADIKSKVNTILESALSESLKLIQLGQATSFVFSVEPPKDSHSAFKAQLDQIVKEKMQEMKFNEFDYTMNEKFIHEGGKLKNIEYTINLFPDVISSAIVDFEIDLTKANVDYAIFIRRLFSKFLGNQPEKKCKNMYVQVKEKQKLSEAVITKLRITTEKILNEMYSEQTFSVTTQKSVTNSNTIDLYVNCHNLGPNPRSFGFSIGGGTLQAEAGFLGTKQKLTIDLTHPGVNVASNLQNIFTVSLPNILSELRTKNSVKLSFNIKPPKSQGVAYVETAKNDLSIELRKYFGDCRVAINPQPVFDSLGFLQDIIFDVSLEKTLNFMGILEEGNNIVKNLFKPGNNIALELSNKVKNLLPKIVADLRLKQKVSFKLTLEPPSHSNSEYMRRVQDDLMTILCIFFPNCETSVVAKVENSPNGILKHVYFDINLQQRQIGLYGNISPMEEIKIFLSKPDTSLHSEISMKLKRGIPNLMEILNNNKPVSLNLLIYPPVHRTVDYIKECNREVLLVTKNYFPNRRIELIRKVLLDDKGYLASTIYKIDIYPDTNMESLQTASNIDSDQWMATSWNGLNPIETNLWETKAHPGSNPWDVSNQPGTNPWELNKPPGTNPWELNKPPGTNPWDINKPPGTNQWDVNKPPGTNPWDINKPPGMNQWESKPPETNQWDVNKPPGTNPWDINKPPGTNQWDVNKPPGTNPWDINKPPGINQWESKPPETNQWDVNKPPGTNPWDINKPPGMNQWESKPPGTNPWEANQSPSENPLEPKPPGTNPWDINKPPGMNQWESKPPGTNPWEANQSPSENPLEPKPPGTNPWDINKPLGPNPWETNKPHEVNPWETNPPGSNSWETNKPHNASPWATRPPETNSLGTTEPPGVNSWNTNPPESNSWNADEPPVINTWKTTESPDVDQWGFNPPKTDDVPWGLQPPGMNPLEPTKPYDISNPQTWESTKPPGVNSLDINKPPGMHPSEMNPWNINNPPGINSFETTYPPSVEPMGINNRMDDQLTSTYPPATNAWEPRPPVGNQLDTTRPTLDMKPRIDIGDVFINNDTEVEETVISTVRKHLVSIRSMLDDQQNVEIPFVVTNSDIHYKSNDMMPMVIGIFQQYLPNVIITLKTGNNNRFFVEINPVKKNMMEIDLRKPGQNIHEKVQQKFFEIKRMLGMTLSEDKKVELVFDILKPDNESPRMVVEIVRMLDDLLTRTFPDTKVKFSIIEKDHSKVEIVVDLSTTSTHISLQKESTNIVVSIERKNIPPINMIDEKIKSMYTTLRSFLDERKQMTLVLDVDLPVGSNDLTVRRIIDHLRQILGKDFPKTAIGITPYVNRDPQNLLTEMIMEVSLNSYSGQGSIQVENVRLDLSNQRTTIISEIQKILPHTIETIRKNLIQQKPVTLNLQIRPPEETKEWYNKMLPDAILPILTSPFCNNEKQWSITANTDLDGYLVDISMIITFEPFKNSKQFEITECEQNILIDLTRPDSRLDIEIDKFLPTVYPDIQMFLEQGRTESLIFKIIPPLNVDKDYIKKTEAAVIKILQNYFPYNEVGIRVSADSPGEGLLTNVLMTLTIKPEANPLPPASINLLLDLSMGRNIELYTKNVLHKYKHVIKILLSKDRSATISFKVIPPKGVDESYFKQLSSSLMHVMNKLFKKNEVKVQSKAGKNSKGEIFAIRTVVTLSH
ncbi:uncharacterized protein LOC123684618 [Harmonia axyridis]|uniref:uncharacterized protein LOC123684618 n=1 Tax=Harmonia axyridis TaxID=115357 RepID=UPI001E2795DD|nr:uncharacterized protein LOC123684618 [Harmonia axyridis]